MSNPTPQKRCTKCDQVQPVSAFYRTSRRTSYRSKCKRCVADAYARDPERYIAAAKAWQAANPERVKRNVARYSRENPELRRELNARRRALAGRLRVEDVRARLAYFGNVCWMCGGAATSVDHVKPIKLGGPHILANLRPACTPCNSRKSARWYGAKALDRFKV